MTDRQENKLSMYLAVQKVCNTHSSVWGGLKAFSDAFNEFKGLIDDIRATRLVQEGKITGVALDKQKEEDEMIAKTVEVASAVFAYASVKGNNELKVKVSYSPSDLKRSRDTELRDKCQVVHDEAHKVVSELADYGITAAVLSELQKEINDFASILAQPRAAISTRAEATTRLAALFDKTDDVLKNRLDSLAKTMEQSGKIFYLQYQSARIIVDLGIRTEVQEKKNKP